MKYYSDITKEKYDTVEALEADEKKFEAERQERRERLKKKAEEERKAEEVRKAKEAEICTIAKEVADKRELLREKLNNYTKEYNAFVIPDDIKDDKAVVNEIMSNFRLFPFSHFFF